MYFYAFYMFHLKTMLLKWKVFHQKGMILLLKRSKQDPRTGSVFPITTLLRFSLKVPKTIPHEGMSWFHPECTGMSPTRFFMKTLNRKPCTCTQVVYLPINQTSWLVFSPKQVHMIFFPELYSYTYSTLHVITLVTFLFNALNPSIKAWTYRQHAKSTYVRRQHGICWKVMV